MSACGSTNGVRLENVYVPAGGERCPTGEQNPKFGQKLDFLGRMIDWAEKLDVPTILTGDFNIAPLESDVWNKQLVDVVSHTPVECELLGRLQAAHDWVNIGRKILPCARAALYLVELIARRTGWRRTGAAGLTIWVSPQLADKAVSHRVAENCRSWARPSDHAPLITEFVF